MTSSSDRQTSSVNSRALYQPLLEACKTALDRYDALKQSTRMKRTAQTAGLSNEAERPPQKVAV